MPTEIPPDLAKALRSRAAEVIAGSKAYDVPALCVRLGLAGGDADEAMRSKFKYAHSRLMELSPAQVISAAHLLLKEESDFWLAENLAKVDEQGTPPVSMRTRRRLFDAFNGHQLCTEYDEIEFLERVFPLPGFESRPSRTSALSTGVGFRQGNFGRIGRR